MSFPTRYLNIASSLEFHDVRKVVATRSHQSDGAADNPLVGEECVAVDCKSLSHIYILEIVSGMLETKENPPFNEMFS